ncbi:hypothetical protein [ANMV-1 virus]|nr:hypothetical protein [ANMV-1 virus]
MSENYHHFSDFAKTHPRFDGKKMKIVEILNKEILVTGFRIGKSKYRGQNYLTLQFKLEGEKYIVFVGSKPLIAQAEEGADEMPYRTTIIQIANYYIMT